MRERSLVARPGDAVPTHPVRRNRGRRLEPEAGGRVGEGRPESLPGPPLRGGWGGGSIEALEGVETPWERKWGRKDCV